MTNPRRKQSAAFKTPEGAGAITTAERVVHHEGHPTFGVEAPLLERAVGILGGHAPAVDGRQRIPRAGFMKARSELSPARQVAADGQVYFYEFFACSCSHRITDCIPGRAASSLGYTR